MAVLTAQPEASAGVKTLQKALELPHTREHLRKHVSIYLLNKNYSHLDADDITQDCLTRAWVKRDEYDPQYLVNAWLHGFIVYVIREHARKQGRMITRDPLDIDALVAANESRAREIADSQELLAVILPQLSGDEQVLYQLQTAEQLTQEEMAQRLKIAPIALRVRLCRMKKHIQELAWKHQAEVAS